MFGIGVCVVETDGLFATLAQREYNFEESFGHSDFQFVANGLVSVALIYRTTYDIDTPFALCPLAARTLSKCLIFCGLHFTLIHFDELNWLYLNIV